MVKQPTRYDHTGEIFGHWTVLSKVEKDDHPKGRSGCWNCICSCGTERIKEGNDLRTGRSESCGCTLAEFRRDDHTGKVYGELTALRVDPASIGTTQLKWICLCSCGKEVGKFASSLKTGEAKDCGHSRVTMFEEDIGAEFGYLTVIDLLKAPLRYKLRCRCGNEVERPLHSLLGKQIPSCGCITGYHRLGRGEDRTPIGQKFGCWTVLSYSRPRYWNARCDCGTEQEVEGPSLRNGTSSSCRRCGYKRVSASMSARHAANKIKAPWEI